jgi:hypothetical protein
MAAGRPGAERPPRARAERGAASGAASAELLWVLPFILVCLLVAVQLFIVGATAVSANAAARAGARASSIGGSGQAAARDALVPWLRGSARIVAGRGYARVQVRIPLLISDLPYVSDDIPRTLSRSAQMPVPDDFGVGF